MESLSVKLVIPLNITVDPLFSQNHVISFGYRNYGLLYSKTRMGHRQSYKVFRLDLLQPNSLAYRAYSNMWVDIEIACNDSHYLSVFDGLLSPHGHQHKFKPKNDVIFNFH